ncbi:hypothetical protein [uncultured Lactobacillus sp.]|uniref:hypothetical protein n=1 Tax=uncultured Lactobacillus sp. TaxID=153152 RepID=UPI002619C1B6|nr:hypothetical protein [uncultured Lactobacillus sp.]
MSNISKFFRELNKRDFMPIIWLSLLAVVIWIICPLVHLSRVWRVGLIFFIFNSFIAFEIGHLMDIKKLSKWWLLLFPLIFALAVTIHFAKYNYLLCIVYLCFELFGLWRNDFYHEKK